MQQEDKNNGKFQGRHLKKVAAVTYDRWSFTSCNCSDSLGKFQFGQVVVSGRWSLTRSSRTWRFHSLRKQSFLLSEERGETAVFAGQRFECTQVLTRPRSSLSLLLILTRETGSREALTADAVLGLPRPFLDRLQIIRDDWGRVRCRRNMLRVGINLFKHAQRRFPLLRMPVLQVILLINLFQHVFETSKMQR